MSRQRNILSRHVWRGEARQSFNGAVATGFADLDQRLPGGGWPNGAITEICLERYGIGELRLLMPALARLSVDESQRKWIVWVSPPFVPYAPALTRHGVRLERILVVHPSAQKRDSFWAVEQALRSGASAAVLAWVRSADSTVLRRLQLAAEERQCWAVLFRPIAAARQSSPAALRLMLSAQGAKTRVDILKCRGARPGRVDLDLAGAGEAADAGEAEW